MSRILLIWARREIIPVPPRCIFTSSVHDFRESFSSAHAGVKDTMVRRLMVRRLIVCETLCDIAQACLRYQTSLRRGNSPSVFCYHSCTMLELQQTTVYCNKIQTAKSCAFQTSPILSSVLTSTPSQQFPRYHVQVRYATYLQEGLRAMFRLSPFR